MEIPGEEVEECRRTSAEKTELQYNLRIQLAFVLSYFLFSLSAYDSMGLETLDSREQLLTEAPIFL